MSEAGADQCVKITAPKRRQTQQRTVNVHNKADGEGHNRLPLIFTWIHEWSEAQLKNIKRSQNSRNYIIACGN